MMTTVMDQLPAVSGRGSVATDAPLSTGRRRAPSPAAPSSSALRRVLAGLLVGSLTMFGVATLDTLAGATVPVLGSFAALPAQSQAPEAPPAPEIAPPPPATPGTCLTWSQADASDTAVVDCAQAHLFEQAGSVLLSEQATLPDDTLWRQLVNERCGPVIETYLGGAFDQAGRYRIGALKPSPARWDGGDRELRCGLQSASRSGALFATTGTVAENDQSAVHEAGTCLGVDGKQIGDPVDCGGAHAVEVVGVVNLAEKFPDAFPSVGDQDAYLPEQCGKIAADYAGGEQVIADKGLTVYWNNMLEQSWAAGSRQVNCNLGALLPDRSGFAPVTGSVKGEVSVGEEMAPPMDDGLEPGVPAPSTTAPATPAPAEPPVDGAPTPVPDGVQPVPAPEQPAPPVDGTTAQLPPPESAPTQPGSPILPDLSILDG